MANDQVRCTITPARPGLERSRILFAHIFNNLTMLRMADTWDGLE